MSKVAKLLAAMRNNSRGVLFTDLLRLVRATGFEHDRTAGSHHIYRHRNYPDVRLNLQPSGKEAKEYQVRQVLKAIDDKGLEVK